MKISYNGLKTFFKIDLPSEQVADLLTDIGLEVEGITTFESIKGGLRGVVVGEVLSCAQHPNADRLRIAEVAIGTDAPLQIVCGAPNVAVGQKVSVATIGTVLYKAKESFTIKKSKIRGAISCGMICAEDELGLGDSHEGIMILDKNLKVGTPLQEVFKVENDTIFEIGLTPNRADAMSHLGVARDLRAVILQRMPKEKNAQTLRKPAVENFRSQTQHTIDIAVERPDGAGRYAGVLIEQVQIKPSPHWIQNRLKALGLKPINNVVDITNYVLHELGQPLHAFDLQKIKDEKILVKTLKDKTKFTTLEGTQRSLSSEDLMICDGQENPLCLAGILGGIDSGVTQDTKNIFLESAYFDSVAIRKSAKRHGLNTDASFRFERGTDITMVVYALKRAALLIQQTAGGSIGQVVDIYKKDIAPFDVELSYRQIEKLAGQTIPQKTLHSILEHLDIKILKQNAEKMFLQVPSYRVDVQRPADVIEEILRIYGYNNIAFSNHFKMPVLENNPEQKYYKTAHKISNYLVGQGFYQIMNNSLTQPAYVEQSESVSVENPLSGDLSVMRQSLLFGGLESIVYNINRQHKNVRFFEWGNVYYKKEKYQQEKRLGIWLSGNKIESSWYEPDKAFDFYYLKDVVFNLAKQLQIGKINMAPVEDKHFEQAVALYVGKIKLGTLGVVNDSLLQHFQIAQKVFYADLYWEVLLQLSQHKNTIRLKDLPKYPEVHRDFALLIDENITFGALSDLALRTEKKILKKVALFDVYQGDKIPKGKKSYALRFVLQDATQTLNDKQIDKVMARLQKSFERTFGASLR